MISTSMQLGKAALSAGKRPTSTAYVGYTYSVAYELWQKVPYQQRTAIFSLKHADYVDLLGQNCYRESNSALKRIQVKL